MVYATHIETGTKIQFRTASSFLMNCLIACEKFNSMGLKAEAPKLGEQYTIVVL